MSDMIIAGRSQYNDIMFARSHVLAAIDVTARYHVAALYGTEIKNYMEDKMMTAGTGDESTGLAGLFK